MPPRKTQPNKSTEQFLKLASDLHGMFKDSVTQAEMVEAIKALMARIQQAENRIAESVAKNKGVSDTATQALAKELDALKERLSTAIEATKQESGDALAMATEQLRKEVKAVQDLIPVVEHPDYTARFAEIEAKIPTLPPEKLGEDYRNALEALTGEDRLDKSAIRGIELIEEEIAQSKKDRSGRVIAPSRGMFLYIDGVKKGLISNMNLVAGTNLSIAYSKVNGQDTLTFNATGGGPGGLTVETPTGTVNAVNTVFTVSAEPQWVVADGTTYFDGAGYTYGALTVTMDIPPSASIKAII